MNRIRYINLKDFWRRCFVTIMLILDIFRRMFVQNGWWIWAVLPSGSTIQHNQLAPLDKANFNPQSGYWDQCSFTWWRKQSRLLKNHVFNKYGAKCLRICIVLRIYYDRYSPNASITSKWFYLWDILAVLRRTYFFVYCLFALTYKL